MSTASGTELAPSAFWSTASALTRRVLHGGYMQALQVCHTRVVDTALLFNVKNLPRWTLSLKDLVLELFTDHPEASSFQRAGCAHDSVLDAKWALWIVAAEAKRVQAGSEPTLMLQTVPQRFLSQLQVSCGCR
eukprot:5738508-Pyramimonas_sp.AAC.2